MIVERLASTQGMRLPSHRARWWLWFLVAWVAAAAYVGSRMDRGWIPLDEGVLGHSAERVLAGDLPHRDFDDVYTGGLSRADAMVFRSTGVRLINLRWALFAVFLLWVPAVFYIARRFAAPEAAAFTTLLCVVWSLPSYPAAMPSWYNLFFATFGTAALMRFSETARKRWIVLAGVLGGLSVLVKIVGVYFIAAALLFLAWDEFRQASERPPTSADRPDRPFVSLLTATLLVFVAALVRLVQDLPSHARYVHFVMPPTLLAAFLVAAEWRRPTGVHSIRRLRTLASLVGPLLLGAALPVMVFLVPYWTSHALGDFVRGVFLAPARRVEFAREPPIPLRTVGAAALWLLVLFPRRRLAGGRDTAARGAAIALAVAAAFLVLATVHGGQAYADVWLAIRYLAPCTVAAGWLLLSRPGSGRTCTAQDQGRIWLLLCMTAMCSLVQVPFAGSYYILYFAPIAILTLLAIVVSRPGGVGARPAIAAGFFLVFGIACVNPGHISVVGAYAPRAAWPTVPLALPRTGLRSSPIASSQYARVVELLRTHSQPGGFTYAAPDCPELYFLSQLKNPTRTLFDFFDEPAAHDSIVLRAIESHHVTAVALNSTPLFSHQIDATLAAELRSRFPDSATVDNFVVRWRAGQ